MKRLLRTLTLFALLVTFACVPVLADEYDGENYMYFESDESGYGAYVVDDARLLTEYDRGLLLQDMWEMLPYGNAIFLTLADNPYYDGSGNKSAAAKSYAEYYYSYYFPASENGVLFLIDMDTRILWITGAGELQRTITDSFANTITDNVYSYAVDEDYFTCGSKAFSQVVQVLRGQRIARPMKYICNAILALFISFFLNYYLAKRTSKTREASHSEILKNLNNTFSLSNIKLIKTGETRKYSPRSSGSSGGGRSGGGGGGGGGGFSGGGHSF